MVNAMFLSPGLSHGMWGKAIEIGKSSRINDEVVQDQRQRDDNVLQDERQDQPRMKRLNLEEAKGEGKDKSRWQPLTSTDIAKITEKRSKPDKHEHGNG
ncbi:hypothetical protein Tco_0155413 [Tanacetum coccineum]